MVSLRCLVIALTFFVVSVTGPAVAQERTAGNALDVQMTWSALSNRIGTLNSQVTALDTSLNSLKTTVQTLQQAVDGLQTSVNGINTKLTAIGTCGTQQKYWDGTGCVGAANPSKIEGASFRVSRMFGDRTPAPTTNAFCLSKGYDAMTGFETSTSERHTGGSTGGMESYTSGYTVHCVRSVAR